MSEVLQMSDSKDNDTQRDRYLVFLLEDECYGLEIRYVTEIIGMQKITDLPQMPDYIKGIINLRGKIVPVVDMRTRFKREEIPYTDRTCTVVIDILGSTIGLIVDRVDEVVTIPEGSISPPPSFRSSHGNSFIKGVGKIKEDIRLILDCEKLFTEDEFHIINQTIND